MVTHAGKRRLSKRPVTIPNQKVKVHTLDIAPLRSESPLQKRSGMASVLRGSHSFTCTPIHVHPQPE